MSMENITPLKAKKSRKPLTMKQKRSLQIIYNGTAPSFGDAMRQAGYADSTANAPGRNLISRSTAFTELLSSIQDSPLLNQLEGIALGEDKRTALSAIELILRLKGHLSTYSGKVKAIQLSEELQALE